MSAMPIQILWAAYPFGELPPKRLAFSDRRERFLIFKNSQNYFLVAIYANCRKCHACIETIMFVLSESKGDLGATALKKLSILADKAHRYISLNRNLYNFVPGRTQEVMIGLKK